MAIIPSVKKSVFIPIKAVTDYDAVATSTINGLQRTVKLQKDTVYSGVKTDGHYQVYLQNTLIANGVPESVFVEVTEPGNPTVDMALLAIFFLIILAMPFWLPKMIHYFTDKKEAAKQ